jgi:hypothetical protein
MQNEIYIDKIYYITMTTPPATFLQANFANMKGSVQIDIVHDEIYPDHLSVVKALRALANGIENKVQQILST